MSRILTVILFIMLGFSNIRCKMHNTVECQGNCYTGFGTRIWSDGGYLKGNWKEGEMYGYGKQFFGSTSQFAGDMYVGQFGEGGYNGYGTYYSKKVDGSQVGYWKRGKPDGYSKLTFNVHSNKPEKFYEGGWKEGKYDGLGELNYKDSTGKEKYRYVGDFSNGLFDGKGVFYFADGAKYEGVWIQGHSDGLDNFKSTINPLASYISDVAYYAIFKSNRGSSTPLKQIKNSKGMFKILLYNKSFEVTNGNEQTRLNIVQIKDFADSKRYYLNDDQGKQFQISIYADSTQIKSNSATIELIKLDEKDMPRSVYHISATRLSLPEN